MRTLGVCGAVVVLGLAGEARAELVGSVLAGGGGYLRPEAPDARVGGGRLTLGYGAPAGWELGGAVRYLRIGGNERGDLFALTGRLAHVFGRERSWAPFAGVQVGYAFNSTCGGDLCGAGGLGYGAELGVRRTLGTGALQLQLVGDVLIVPSATSRRYPVPTVWVGLGF